MIELPEAVVIAQQIRNSIFGKRIKTVIAAQTPHKFAWYYGDPRQYNDFLSGKVIGESVSHGGLVEIQIEDATLLFGDGVNLGYHSPGQTVPKKHQLHIQFEDDSCIFASVQMYGGLWAFPEGQNDNPYYLIAKEKSAPFSPSFDIPYFHSLLNECSDKISLKTFLATDQRIPGLGNGVLQDILYHAKLHPKKKIGSLSETDITVLYHSIKTTLAEMTIHGGRDTERDLFGSNGGYRTVLSKFTIGTPCPSCGTIIKKEAYMGGSIYFCEDCQQI